MKLMSKESLDKLFDKHEEFVRRLNAQCDHAVTEGNKYRERYLALARKHRELEDRLQVLLLQLALQGYEVVITPAAPEQTKTVVIPAKPEKLTVSKHKRV